MTNYDDSIAEDWKQEIQNQLLVVMIGAYIQIVPRLTQP